MDGSSLEHSDSDSGESWTLLENTPSYADEAPDLEQNSAQLNDTALKIEEDEETDGISTISDSDNEFPISCDMKCDLLDTDPPTDHKTFESIQNHHPSNSTKEDNESIRCEEFLANNKCKLRTYVHRRNQRLSTVLNIIVLGSVITAAGVAIGHMWGAKHSCSMHSAPSVNKILSNLYKLQEENAYLRNKLKELTFFNNLNLNHKKFDLEKGSLKHHRCKKVFEESLNNKNPGKLTKCVDKDVSNDKILESHLVEPEFEKEFINDVDKLRNVYLQNKSWLDTEIARRMKYENESIKKLKNNITPFKDFNEESNMKKDTVVPADSHIANELPATENNNNVKAPIKTYADSLKSEKKLKKRSSEKFDLENPYKNNNRKKRLAKERDLVLENSDSEVDVKKDDRYNSQKYKTERKKNDRQKLHKKQKRKNKYEQWEMKGGYLKDYEDITIASSQDNLRVVNEPSVDIQRNNYVKITESVDDTGKPNLEENKAKHDNHTSKRNKAKAKKDEDLNWYDKRASLRMEARKKLEQELFKGSTTNSAGWYFHRMQRREQCRIKGDNSTYRKFSKRVMNYKTKT